MTLKTGKSRAAIAYNVKTEVRHRKTHRQAVAIALRKAGYRRRKRKGRVRHSRKS